LGVKSGENSRQILFKTKVYNTLFFSLFLSTK